MKQTLTAGPIDVDYADGELWAIRVNGVEVIRRIHIVFQDHNWHSRPWIIEFEEVEAGTDHFRVDVTARGTTTAKNFTWTATITGERDGTIRVIVTGSTTEAFWRNRLGLCILHPIDGLAGEPCTMWSPDGTWQDRTFPRDIAPFQPFRDICAMEYVCGERVHIAFTGDVFEVEDHRNWGDASFKTYCTPLDLPRPVQVEPGDVLRQTLTITWPDGPTTWPDGPTRRAQPPLMPTLTVQEPSVPLPALGVVATPGIWSDTEIDDLAALGLDHLYAWIDLASPSASRDLADAARHARAIHARLRVALVDGTLDDMTAMTSQAHELADLIDCWYVFRRDEPVTSATWIANVRAVLGPNSPLGGGTDVYFTELNRQHPDLTDLSWVNVPITPQQHSFDDRTVVQNLATLEAIARNLPRVAGDLPVSVSPLTLRRRINPYASDPTSDVSNDALPPNVDARQRTWFAGAWLAIALRNLALPETVSVITCFEALGWRGIRESDAGSADEEHFASLPGERFAVYDVLRALRGFDRVLATTSTAPEEYDALMVTDGRRVRAIAANFGDVDRDVIVTGDLDYTLTLPAQSLTIVDLPGGTP